VKQLLAQTQCAGLELCKRIHLLILTSRVTIKKQFTAALTGEPDDRAVVAI